MSKSYRKVSTKFERTAGRDQYLTALVVRERIRATRVRKQRRAMKYTA
jgi:hypothetical protein